jgi:hypothetical protein
MQVCVCDLARHRLSNFYSGNSFREGIPAIIAWVCAAANQRGLSRESRQNQRRQPPARLSRLR